jgi:ribonuclease HI
VETPSALLPSAPFAGRKSFRPEHPSVEGLTEAELTHLATDCEKVAASLLRKWQGTSQKCGVVRRRGWLNRIAHTLLTRIKRTALRRGERGDRGAGNGTASRSALAPLDRLRALRAAAGEVKEALREIAQGEHVRMNAQYKHKVGQLQALLGFCPGPASDVKVWKGVVARMERETAATMKELLRGDTRLEHSGNHRALLHRVFHRDKDMGRFIEEYLRPSSSRGHAVDHVTVNGRVIWEPDEYKPVVRDHVSAPMKEALLFRKTKVYNPPALAPVTAEGTFPSTDARSTGGRPHWWARMYATKDTTWRPGPSARAARRSVFSDVMREVSLAELLDVIRGSKAGTSPGHDGVGIDLIKVITDSARLAGRQSSVALAMAFIVNQCLLLGHIPRCLKEGWITLVPKVKENGAFSMEPAEMRPITVLPALGKLCTKVLADRVGDVLVARPHILAPAQRAFLKDGYLDQCLDTVVDVIEDWNECKRGKSPLFVLSYDQRRAYDSVQGDTIRASLERLNLPPLFVDLVLSGLDDAWSRVRTEGGLTERFKLGSSVRQGCPLSPLVYAMVMDVLHTGFEENPIFPVARTSTWGYTFQDSGRPVDGVRVCSSGYADDTVIVAESAAALAEMHCWVREFYGANFFSFNPDKTKLLCSHPSTAPPIPTVDGLRMVTARPTGETFRYLGLFLNLDLDWSVQIGRMERSVWSVCSKIRMNKFDLVMSTDAVRQFLLPRIRIGLALATIPPGVLEEWDNRIRLACLTGAGMVMGPDLNKGAFYLGGVPRLADHCWAMRAEELIVRLDASFPSSATGWARMSASALAPHGRGRGGRAADTVRETKARFACVIRSRPEASLARGRLLTVVAAGALDSSVLLAPAWLPHKRPALVFAPPCAAGHDETEAHIFTDGSTGADGTLPTGCSVVKVLPGAATVTRGFASPRNGDNFAAEFCALVAALQSVPEHVHLCVYTDSSAVIGAINKGRVRWYGGPVRFRNSYALSQRRRLLSACRPMASLARALISARSGRVTLVKVKAHTGSLDRRSVFNEVADRVANEARVAAESAPYPPRPLAGEVKVGLWLPNRRGAGCGAEVSGSFRKALLRRAEIGELARLGSKPHQGRLARACGPQLLVAFRAARKSRSPQLLRFFIEAAVEYLPTERRLVVRRAAAGRGEACKLCGAATDTCLHALGQCTHAGVAWRRRAVLRAAGLLHRDTGAAEVATVPAYFDPGHSDVTVGISAPGGRVQGPEALVDHPAFATFLGIPPPHLAEWLRRPGDDLAKMQARASELTLTLMWGAMSVWSARCAAMNALLPSAGNGFADGLVERLLARKRTSTALAREKAEARFVARNAERTAKREARQAGQGTGPAVAAGTSVAVGRPRRSLLVRTRSEQYGHFVSRQSEAEERQEVRAELLRGTEVVFPAY